MLFDRNKNISDLIYCSRVVCSRFFLLVQHIFRVEFIINFLQMPCIADFLCWCVQLVRSICRKSYRLLAVLCLICPNFIGTFRLVHELILSNLLFSVLLSKYFSYTYLIIQRPCRQRDISFFLHSSQFFIVQRKKRKKIKMHF